MAANETKSETISINEKILQDNLLNRNISTPPRTDSPSGRRRDVAGGLAKLHVDEGSTRRKIALLRAKANALLAQLKFQDASKTLDELSSIQPAPDLDTCLLMADCYLLVGREAKGIKAIDEIRTSLLASSSPSANEVVSLGNDFIESSSFVRATVLFIAAAYMYETYSSSEKAKLDGLYNCANKIHNAVCAMVQAGDRLRVIAADFGIPYMSQILKFMRSVKKVYPDTKELLVAWSVNCIGYAYGLLGDNAKSLETRLEGLDGINRHFGANAEKYRICGVLQHNIGVAYFNLTQYAEAEKYYSKAIQSKRSALDYDSEKDQKDDVERSQKNHLNTLQKLP